MTVHKDPYDEIEYAKPPPAPISTLHVVPPLVSDAISKLAREAMRLQQSGPAEFLEWPFMRLVAGLLKLQKLVEPVLPGMEVCQTPPAKKNRCTEIEARDFCRSLSLPEDDGSWFYEKMMGCGWKNGSKPVADWQFTIRAWKRAGYMASQRIAARNQLPANAPKNHVSSEIDSQLRRIRKGVL